MMQYIDGFDGPSGVASLFADDSVNNYQIIIAVYDTPAYEGYAYVLAMKDGELYENTASHCSCYGLEGMWKPAKVTHAYLQNRVENGSFGYCQQQDTIKQKVTEFLAAR
jgi:hypothetical protein